MKMIRLKCSDITEWIDYENLSLSSYSYVYTAQINKQDNFYIGILKN